MTQTVISVTQQGHYASANGLQMFYEEYGTGEPLILLHGGTGLSQMWQPHIRSLASHFRVITPDSRGHGRTNNPTGAFGYRTMADDVVAFIQALGLKKPLIFGYSLGGQIALEIGMHYPNLAKALVVGATSYKFSKVYLNSLKVFFSFEEPGVVNFDMLQESDPDLVQFWKSVHSWTDDPDYWKTLLRQMSEMWLKPPDYAAEDLQNIAEPTLILMGDRDGMVPLEEVVEMYHLIPNAELAILPNVSHMTALLEDGVFLGVVLDFLLRHCGQEKNMQ